MRLLYISDTTYWQHEGAWHTAIPWPAEFMASRLRAASITFVGRLVKSGIGAVLPVTCCDGTCSISISGARVRYRGPLGYVMSYPQLRSVVRKALGTADVVYIKPGILSLIAEPWLRPDHLVVYHQVGELDAGMKLIYPRYSFLSPLLVRHGQRVARRADIVAFVSRYLAKQSGSTRSDSLISNESRLLENQVSSDMRSATNSPPRVIFLGRLSREKGVEILPELSDLLPHVHFVIAGDGPLRGWLYNEFRQRDALARVSLVGRIEPGQPVLNLLRHMDLLLLPSWTEGMGLVLVEAMSQGVPCVATAVGGIPEIIQHGVNGITVPLGDVEGFAAAVDRALHDRSFRARAIPEAIATARQHTIDRQSGPLLDRIRELYQERFSAQ